MLLLESMLLNVFTPNMLIRCDTGLAWTPSPDGGGSGGTGSGGAVPDSSAVNRDSMEVRRASFAAAAAAASSVVWTSTGIVPSLALFRLQVMENRLHHRVLAFQAAAQRPLAARDVGIHAAALLQFAFHLGDHFVQRDGQQIV